MPDLLCKNCIHYKVVKAMAYCARTFNKAEKARQLVDGTTEYPFHYTCVTERSDSAGCSLEGRYYQVRP